MFARDVNNLRAMFGRVAPELLEMEYALEIWGLYEAAELAPETPLTGLFTRDETVADVGAFLDQIEEARREAEARQRGREQAQEESHLS